MRMSERPWLRWWVASWLVFGGVELGALLLTDRSWEAPHVLFWVVVVAAGLCVLTSGAVIWRAWRSGPGEAALVGSFFMSASLLPLAHGITTPGVLYGPNTATMATIFWAIPAGAVAVIPLAAPRSRWANRLLQRWKPWVVAHTAGLVLIFAVALIWPNAIWVPAMGSREAIAGVVVSLAACIALSYRHLRLAWIAQDPRPLAVSVGAALVGSATIVFVGDKAWTLAFWMAHALDIAGVFLATLIGARIYRRTGSVAAVLAPVEAMTPLRAVELSLDPLVHRFVAALEHKDEITRDHVVRAAEMTSLVASEMGVPARDHSTVVLGGLLHDVGKLDMPDHILKKAGRLTDEEFAIVKRHPLDGAAMVEASGCLADLAPVVRHHHERVDGGGYPDGLAGAAIPLGARIVAACDAYDAMANTRQYREGMGPDKALAILSEHQGSQWDSDVVAALHRVVTRHGTTFNGDALATVGRNEYADVEGFAFDHAGWCGCADALPAGVTQPQPQPVQPMPQPVAATTSRVPEPPVRRDIDDERPWRPRRSQRTPVAR